MVAKPERQEQATVTPKTEPSDKAQPSPAVAAGGEDKAPSETTASSSTGSPATAGSSTGSPATAADPAPISAGKVDASHGVKAFERPKVGDRKDG